LRVCLICNEYPPAPHGGIGPVTRQLAEGLADLGHGVWVVGLFDQPDDLVEVIQGVKVYRFARIGTGALGELRSRRKFADKVAQLHKQHQFDIIEAPEWRGDSALLKVDCPVVLRLHTSHVVDRMVTGHSRPGRLTAFFESRALTRAGAVCAVSGDIARKTAEAFPDFKKRLAQGVVPVIHNAIELDLFQATKQTREPGLIAFAGSLKQVKGLENLIKAFALVLENRDCRLVLAGPDTRTPQGASYLESCLAAVAPAVREKVEALGRQPRDKVAELFRAASVVVLPSLQEACPMVVMEAMACGAPTIFGSCGPHTEIIEDGVDGLVCNQHDSKDIADKISRILDDPGFAIGIGEAARKRAESHFTIERFLQQSLDFYQQTQQKFQRKTA
jgi:glycosyltransferase involved in cell wall biosynthesis